jgi:hypothetical protein
MNERSGSAIRRSSTERPAAARRRHAQGHRDAPAMRPFWDAFIARREQLYERVSRANGDENPART